MGLKMGLLFSCKRLIHNIGLKVVYKWGIKKKRVWLISIGY